MLSQCSWGMVGILTHYHNRSSHTCLYQGLSLGLSDTQTVPTHDKPISPQYSPQYLAGGVPSRSGFLYHLRLPISMALHLKHTVDSGEALDKDDPASKVSGLQGSVLSAGSLSVVIITHHHPGQTVSLVGRTEKGGGSRG